MTLELYKVVEINDNYLRISIPGNDFPLLNSLRKIILNDIPSMAITSVFITENTSSLVDEVLAHRIGLLHLLAVDTDFIEFSDDDNYDENNSLKFGISVIYSPKKNCIMSSDLIWIEQGKQKKFLTLEPKVVHEDVLLCRLAPGQQVQLEALATKGRGKDNAKFNIVSSCYYRQEDGGKSCSFIIEAENGISPEIILKQGIKILKSKSTYTYHKENEGDGE